MDLLVSGQCYNNGKGVKPTSIDYHPRRGSAYDITLFLYMFECKQGETLYWVGQE